MIHNVTEGLGIAAPAAPRSGAPASSTRRPHASSRARRPSSVPGSAAFLTNDFLGVVFFAAAAGAALEVVVEVGRFVLRRAPGGLTSGHVVGGFLAGIAAMYVTGLLVG